jgi:hypothetical protein
MNFCGHETRRKMQEQIEKLDKGFEEAIGRVTETDFLEERAEEFFSRTGAPPMLPDTDKFEIISVSIFPEAWGKKWNMDVLNILYGLNPSLIRVCSKADSSPCVNRITVWVDKTPCLIPSWIDGATIQRIEKEVMIPIPENRKHGQDVKSRAMRGNTNG